LLFAFDAVKWIMHRVLASLRAWRRRTRLVRGATYSCAVFALAFLWLCGWIVADGWRENVQPCDVGVVLGNTVYPDGRLSPRLQARLDRALQLYQQGVFPIVLVSGGPGLEGRDEASAMKAYLVAQGIPDERVLMDPEGHNTYLTAQNTRHLMQERGWTRACAVSQYFHLPRCRLVFAQLGIPTTYAACPPYVEARDFYAIAREGLGYVGYLFRVRG
jgi:vancomycin permeability regulator SanA